MVGVFLEDLESTEDQSPMQKASGLLGWLGGEAVGSGKPCGSPKVGPNLLKIYGFWKTVWFS